MLQSVSADLDLKIRISAVSMGARSKLPTRVRVKVITQRQGKEESGYLIRFYPSFPPFRNDITRARIFSNPSSPTSELVVPGTYVAKAYQHATLVLEQDVQVGVDGESEQAVIVLLDAR
jgi:hypothetical protein